MFVKPAAGLSVPDPERGGLLAAEGRKVALTTYWHKRAECDDVVVSDTAPTADADTAAVQSSAPSADKPARPGK